jgi:hypothetical protein
MSPASRTLLALLSVACALGCSRPSPGVQSTERDVQILPPLLPHPAASPPETPPVVTADAIEGGLVARDAGEACRKLPINVGGTLERQSFEGRIALATGHDPEQGDGTFPVLVLDAPVCGAYTLPPQKELLVGVLGGKAKWEELGARWNGQRVRVTGDVRSMDIYIRPLRHFLLFASHVEPLP